MKRGDQRPIAVRDEGSLLVLCMVLVVVSILVVFPILEFGIGVTRANRVAKSRSVAAEAVKGGLRTALADPRSLYRACGSSTPSTPVALAGPGLTTSVSTTCAKVGESQATDSGRYGSATTMVGALVPAEAGRQYPGSGGNAVAAWYSNGNATLAPASNTIWLPPMPQRVVTERASTGFAMPSVFGACTVFFPGVYNDPITLTAAGMVFFASGIYTFTNTVTIEGEVDVVMGDGALQGCATDYEAATYALDAPSQHGISGLGATFILSGAGRLTIRAPLASGTARVRFNQRYVTESMLLSDSSAGVSLMSANGALDQHSAWVSLEKPGVLSVPTPTMLDSQQTSGLAPSTMVAQNPLPAGGALVDIDVTGAQAADIQISGYVVVPQGAVSIKAAAATKANKSVRLNGGATAAMFDVSVDRPGTFVLDIVNPIVQRTFKLVSTATAGTAVTSTAVVIVNQNGAYAIKSWTVQ